MFGRAVIAFRKTVIKSKSSNGISNSDRDEDEDACNESIISSNSLSVASYASENRRRASMTSTPNSRLSLLRRQRRSQSVNREGDDAIIKISIEDRNEEKYYLKLMNFTRMMDHFAYIPAISSKYITKIL